jgi:hypothetical protein
MGEPFRTVFGLSGQLPEWWVAEYDHQENWLQTGWRKSNVVFNPVGIEISLSAADEQNIVSPEVYREDPAAFMEAGKTSKRFLSGQIQRRGWYGYGRYEIIMQPAQGDGVISAFYIYTGSYFGDTHEEIDIEVLGRDTSKVQLNRFRDGQSFADPVSKDVGLDTSEQPQLFAFDWQEDAIVWYLNDTELFRIDDAAEVPVPPAKIYIDMWAGGEMQSEWAGEADADVNGYALIQCASFTTWITPTPQCSDLKAGN